MKKIFFSILLLSVNLVHAQTDKEFWTRINVTKSFTKNFDGGIDIQYRRQNGFQAEHSMFHYPMTSSVRLWGYYHFKRNWTILLSPLAYFDNQLVQADSKELKSITEVRTMLGMVKGFNIGKFSNNNRILYELSSIKSANVPNTLRQRYRLQNTFGIPLKEFPNKRALSFHIQNELFFKSINSKTGLDQNRIFNAVVWTGGNNGVSAGYQYTVQLDGKNIINRKQVLLNYNVKL